MPRTTPDHEVASREACPPTTAALRALLNGPPGARASIHLPVPADPGFDEVQAFPREVRRALEEARERLREVGAPPEEEDAVVGRLAAWDLDLALLPPSTRSVALLGQIDRAACFASSETVARSVRAGRSHHVRPLLRAIHTNVRYRVLALSRDRVRLFEGDAAGLRALNAPEVPPSLADALGSERTQSSLQHHPGSIASGDALYHGHGGASRDRAVDLERFHRALARPLRELWKERDVPVVLAAERSHAGHFREQVALPGAIDEIVAGNPDRLTAAKLHEAARPLIARWKRARLAEERERARNGRARERSIDDLGPLASAAVSGRVARLWTPLAARVARHVDPETGRLDEARGDEDALDEIAAAVLLHGGEVFVEDDAEGEGEHILEELRE